MDTASAIGNTPPMGNVNKFLSIINGHCLFQCIVECWVLQDGIFPKSNVCCDTYDLIYDDDITEHEAKKKTKTK